MIIKKENPYLCSYNTLLYKNDEKKHVDDGRHPDLRRNDDADIVQQG